MHALIGRSDAIELRALNVDTDIVLPESFCALDFANGLSLLKPGDWGKVGLAGQALADTWYLINSLDPTTAFGLSFGQYIAYEMKRVFTVVCRHIALLNELQPSRILFAVDGSLISRASEAYALALRLPMEKVPSFAVSKGTEWSVASTTESSSTMNRVEALVCRASWFRRFFRGRNRLTFFVRPHGYAATLVEAILQESRHRIVLTEFVREYAGHPRVMFADWRHAPLPANADVLGARSWDLVDDAVSRAGLSYLGVNLWPVVRQAAHSFWKGEWRAFSRQANYLRCAYKTLRPDAIIVAQDQSGYEKAMIMIASPRDILTVAIDHGIGLYRSPGGLPPARARMLAVYGNECKRLSDPAIETVVTVGNDDLMNLARRVAQCDREKLRERIGVTTSFIPVILFAAGPYVNLLPDAEPAAANEILETICRVAVLLPHAVTLVRLHPGTSAYESVDLKREIVGKYNRGNLILDPGFSTAEALASSDIVVTVQSGIGIEAVAARKPLVVYDPTCADAAGYLRGQAGVGAHDECGLLRALQSLTADSHHQDSVVVSGERFIRERVMGYGDGRAGWRLMRAIEDTLRRGKNGATSV